MAHFTTFLPPTDKDCSLHQLESWGLASIELGSCAISKKELIQLLPGGWLSDEVINGVLQVVADNFKQTRFVMSTLVPAMDRVQTDGEMMLGAFADEAVGVETTRLIVPMWWNSHWILCSVDSVQSTVTYFNSMASYDEDCVKLAHHLINVLRMDNPRFDQIDWRVINGHSDQQPNSSDCGLFVIGNAIQLMLGLESPQDQIPSPFPTGHMRLAILVALQRSFEDIQKLTFATELLALLRDFAQLGNVVADGQSHPPGSFDDADSLRTPSWSPITCQSEHDEPPTPTLDDGDDDEDEDDVPSLVLLWRRVIQKAVTNGGDLCEQCGFTFENLPKHEHEAHPWIANGQFPCEYSGCFALFESTVDRDNHYRQIHLLEMFICPLYDEGKCYERFKEEADVRHHCAAAHPQSPDFSIEKPNVERPLFNQEFFTNSRARWNETVGTKIALQKRRNLYSNFASPLFRLRCRRWGVLGQTRERNTPCQVLEKQRAGIRRKGHTVGAPSRKDLFGTRKTVAYWVMLMHHEDAHALDHFVNDSFLGFPTRAETSHKCHRHNCVVLGHLELVHSNHNWDRELCKGSRKDNGKCSHMDSLHHHDPCVFQELGPEENDFPSECNLGVSKRNS